MPTPLDPSVDWLADAPLRLDHRRVWNQLRTQLIETQVKLKETEKKLALLERESQETGQSVLTRPEFNREVARMLAVDERYGGTSSVLYMDFENLDEITARYGHAVANAAIHEISDTLVKQVRTSDVVGRLAVDEFGILLAKCDNASAWKKGKKLVAILLGKVDVIHNHKLNPQISYGAYTFRGNEDVATGLKEAALMVTRGQGSGK